MKSTIVSIATIAVISTLACSEDEAVAGSDDEIVNVRVASTSFTPAEITIKVGQTVRWTWEGGTHNVVSGPDCATEDGNFKSGAPVGGGTFDKKFETAGEFPYYCEPHCSAGMTGRVIVE